MLPPHGAWANETSANSNNRQCAFPSPDLSECDLSRATGRIQNLSLNDADLESEFGLLGVNMRCTFGGTCWVANGILLPS